MKSKKPILFFFHHGETTHLSGEFSVARRNSEIETSLFSLLKENVIGSREEREGGREGRWKRRKRKEMEKDTGRETICFNYTSLTA